jgi:hypothetical protein
MSADLRVRLSNQLCAGWKRFLSHFKRDWDLTDYPVVVREHEIDPTYTGTRLKQHRYSASIVNWGVMTGGGETEQEALEALEKNFTAAKIVKAKGKRRFPRPGTHAPIELASRARVGRCPELEADFIRRVLNLEWAFISDESSLWDFHHAETNEELIAKIRKVYGIDASDIESARISEILERIDEKRVSG